MNIPTKLYRQRMIPEENVFLKDDKILLQNENLIITSWDTLKPRADIARGVSAYFIDKGFKVSKVYDSNNHLVYWYCDIIETVYDAAENTYTFIDLLADILVYEDNSFRLVDLEEIGLALEKGLLSIEKASKALHLTNELLNIIYHNQFSKYQSIINEIEQSGQVRLELTKSLNP